jgi:hypothetical protein
MGLSVPALEGPDHVRRIIKTSMHLPVKTSAPLAPGAVQRVALSSTSRAPSQRPLAVRPPRVTDSVSLFRESNCRGSGYWLQQHRPASERFPPRSMRALRPGGHPALVVALARGRDAG